MDTSIVMKPFMQTTFFLYLCCYVIGSYSNIDFWCSFLYMALWKAIMVVYLKIHVPKMYGIRSKELFMEGQSLTDKVLVLCICGSGMLSYLFALYDISHGRWLLADYMLYIKVFGYAEISVGFVLFILCFTTNEYALPAVTEQKNQKLIQDGIYGYIRHPLYLGSLCIAEGMCCAVGSVAAPCVGISITYIFIRVRIYFEEEYLKSIFTDYVEYKKRVPGALIPYIPYL